MKRIFSALFVTFCGFLSSAFAQQSPQNPPRVVAPIVVDERVVKAEQEIVVFEQKLAADRTDISSARQLYDAYHNLGWRYLWASKYEEAMKAHQRAAGLDSKYLFSQIKIIGVKPLRFITQADILLSSGWEQRARGDHKAALQSYQRAIELEPTLAEAHYELGRLYLALNRKEEVERQLQELHRHDEFLAILLQNEIARGVVATEPGNAPATAVLLASASVKPSITYKEKARYTESARQYRVVGTVLLSVVFAADGRITNIKVMRGLPVGLTEMAIQATEKIRFTPATKDGQAVSVRMSMEFSFDLL